MYTLTTMPTDETQDVPLTTRVSKNVYSQMENLAEHAEKETGFRPSLSEVARKMIEDGLAANAKKRKR
jgi:hypothetical protein